MSLLLMLKLKDIALYGAPPQSYRVLAAIWDHTVLFPALTPARLAATRFIYPRGMEA